MAKAKKGEAEKSAKDWEPISPEEIQQERALQLLYELEDAEQRLEYHSEDGKRLRDEIRSLERQLKTAKRLSVKQRARINTLDRQWRRQWVKEYDRFREAGKDKKSSAALAWSQIKVHCKKKDDVWECPPWRSIYMPDQPDPQGLVYTKGKKKAAKKKAKRKSSKKAKNPSVKLSLNEQQLMMLLTAVRLRVDAAVEGEGFEYTPQDVQDWETIFRIVEHAYEGGRKFLATPEQLGLLHTAVGLRADSAHEGLGDDYTRAEVRAWDNLLNKIKRAIEKT